MFSSLARRRQSLWTFIVIASLSTARAENTPELGWVELSSGRKLEVEIAATRQQREQGLMFRTTLAENRGMLFVFPETQRLAMWMKNTLIALDAIFIAENGKIVSIQSNIQPCHQQSCPTYQSRGKARYMLEIAAGSAEKFGLLPGQELLIDYRHR